MGNVVVFKGLISSVFTFGSCSWLNGLIFNNFTLIGCGGLESTDSGLLGLSYSIYEKTYGDAHAKLEKSSNFQIYPGKTDDDEPLHLKLPEHWVTSSLSNAANESPFKTVN